MTKRTRQLFLASCIMISVIVLPLILLYGSGYRVDWEHRQLTTTGSLIVNSTPPNATVTFNHTATVYHTPVTINQLQPGQYTITVTAPGYRVWQSDLTILPQQTTVFDHVVLLATAPSHRVVESYPSTETLYIEELPTPIRTAIIELSLSDDYTLVSNNNDWYAILDHATGQLFSLHNDHPVTASLLAEHVKQIDLDVTAHRLLWLTDYEITSYDISAQTSQLITRQSSLLDSARWLPQSDYIIVAQQTSIEAFTTNNSAHPLTETLYQGTAPHDVRVDPTTNLVYYQDVDQIIALTIE